MGTNGTDGFKRNLPVDMLCEYIWTPMLKLPKKREKSSFGN